jgi:hypothetical protein
MGMHEHVGEDLMLTLYIYIYSALMLTDVEAPADDDDYENVMQIGSNALLVSKGG